MLSLVWLKSCTIKNELQLLNTLQCSSEHYRAKGWHMVLILWIYKQCQLLQQSSWHHRLLLCAVPWVKGRQLLDKASLPEVTLEKRARWSLFTPKVMHASLWKCHHLRFAPEESLTRKIKDYELNDLVPWYWLQIILEGIEPKCSGTNNEEKEIHQMKYFLSGPSIFRYAILDSNQLCLIGENYKVRIIQMSRLDETPYLK